LEQCDGLAIPDHRNDKFAKASVTAVAQGLRTPPCIEKLRLIAHGAQFRTAAARLKRAAKGLGAGLAFENNRTPPIHGHQSGINAKGSPGEIKQPTQTWKSA
jgi:hypothetical protein